MRSGGLLHIETHGHSEELRCCTRLHSFGHAYHVAQSNKIIEVNLLLGLIVLALEVLL